MGELKVVFEEECSFHVPMIAIPGPTGPKGDTGAGLKIDGEVATYEELPEGLTEEDAGTAYIVKEDGKLYVWYGSYWPDKGEGIEFVVEGTALPTGGTAGQVLAKASDEDDDLMWKDPITYSAVSNDYGGVTVTIGGI